MAELNNLYEKFPFMQMRDKYEKYQEKILKIFENDTSNEHKSDLHVWYGLYYYTKEPQDLANAQKYIELAKKEGNIDAMFLSAYILMEINKDNSIPPMIVAAEKGHIAAMISLVYYYDEKKDETEMIKYANKIIETNKIDAIIKLAKYFRNKDDDKMVEYYEIAANKGSIDAMMQLAKYFRIKNDNKMVEYYEIAANKGSIDAMMELADYYRNKDDDKMVKYYKMAIKMGNPSTDIMIDLANYYENKNNKNEHDDENMVKYLMMAADDESLYAMLRLAKYYEHKHDDENMVKYLEMAAWEKDIEAMMKLATYYKNKSDHQNMIKFCELVAVNFTKYDNTYMLIEIATYYKDISDFDNMEKCYKLAAKYGSPNALSQLAGDQFELEMKKLLCFYTKKINEFALRIKSVLVNN